MAYETGEAANVLFYVIEGQNPLRRNRRLKTAPGQIQTALCGRILKGEEADG
jgi:hypothetical protein